MTRRKTQPTHTPLSHASLGVTTTELADTLGPHWNDLNHADMLDTLLHRLTQLTTNHDHPETLVNDLNTFTVEFIHAILHHGTQDLTELCDTVTNNLGGHTEGTRFALTSIAGLLEADQRHPTNRNQS
jgi:hypothetical protein